ncbi:ABC transporter substrate-binding protein [Lysinibacter sp. HNR]|uniref:ABC transporter substrate-binding protein n=1 Tax=Lysinibacter sp. HNR TaxID=3031408 RepID=UPI002435E67B|nr:ABC transporter substrate-binding protein [Lysinibacter sp. HNR]WGD38302.1 ABC transporter substrate-binding protein [Lysinibacter sp. HNR]
MLKPRLLIVGTFITASLILTSCADSNSGGAGQSTLDIDFSKLATTTESGAGTVDRVTWNLPYEPLSLDPMHTFNYAENTVDANLCEGLTRLTPELTEENALAESVANPDPQTYIYTIRDGVTFWDGSALTADDVVYSLERQLGPGSTTYWTDYFLNVASVEKTADREVTIKLTQPDVLFAQAMSTAAGAIVSQSAAVAAGEAFGTPRGGLQCTGPFSLTSWEPGKAITLSKNPHYWDTDLIPLVEQISFSFIADETTAINALRSGDIDGQYFYLPPAGLSQLNSDNTTTTYGKSYVFWTLRALQETGTFAQPEVRAALLAALDRQAIADVVFQGAALPAPTLTGPDYFGSGPEAELFQEALDSYNTDPDLDRARELLAQAGDISEPIVIAVQGSSAVHEQTVNLIQAAGQAIGLKIEIRVIPVEQYGNIYVDPKAREGLDGFLTTYYGNVPDPLDIYAIFTPGGAYNFTNYNQAGEFIEEARQTLDPVARAEPTIQAQELVTRDLPWTPLNYMPNILVQNKRISGAAASIAYLSYPWAATIGGQQ